MDKLITIGGSLNFIDRRNRQNLHLPPVFHFKLEVPRLCCLEAQPRQNHRSRQNHPQVNLLINGRSFLQLIPKLLPNLPIQEGHQDLAVTTTHLQSIILIILGSHLETNQNYHHHFPTHFALIP